MDRALVVGVFVLMAGGAVAVAQDAVGRTASAQRYAPIDLTGTWVSIVTEDWAIRMLSPPKGDFQGLPLTRAAQDAANRIDTAQLEAAGRACEAYGAPALMRHPGRVRIAWQDPNTLRIETDAGQQRRLLHFNGAEMPRGEPSLQGFSAAEWQYANGFDPLHVNDAPRGAGGRGRGAPAGGAGRGDGRGPAAEPMGGRLKVVTGNLSSGFLRKNGVPYSANATVTEYYNLLREPTGTQWFVVTTIVHDPVNLVVDYITSTNFRKEADDSKWKPQPCSLR